MRFSSKGRVLLGQAIKANSCGASRARVLGYLIKAGATDAKLIVMRKMWTLALEQFITPELKDWIKFLRRPIPGALHDSKDQGDVLFISPHFDDVALSCGGTLAASPKDRTWLVTVFTAPAQTSLSPLVASLHQQWGANTGAYVQRQAEDTAVTNQLGIRSCWLGFHDVIYRDASLTKIEQVFSPTLPAVDITCVDDVRDSLLELVKSHSGCTVLAPLGLGYHRDHLVVHEATRAVERIVGSDIRFFYYEDFPYVNNAGIKGIKRRLHEIEAVLRPTGVDISATLAQRIELAMLYRSQIGTMFGGTEKAAQALTRNALDNGVRGRARERFWHDEAH